VYIQTSIYCDQWASGDHDGMTVGFIPIYSPFDFYKFSEFFFF